LSDVADELSNRRLYGDFHLTTLCVGAPTATGAAFELTNDAHCLLHAQQQQKLSYRAESGRLSRVVIIHSRKQIARN